MALFALLLEGCGLLLDFDDAEDASTGGVDGQAGLDGAAGLDGYVADGSIPPVLGPCDGLGNGTPCAAVGDDLPAICIDGTCVRSYCGDDHVDMALGELCDDGNSVPGDGCDPGCTFSCESDEECDDDRPCNGVESCGGGICVAGPPPADGSPCGTGTCMSATCRLPTCGNGSIDVGEECDDGNTDPGDGCEPDCTRFCNASRACPSTACEVGTCNASFMCVSMPADRDGDSYASGENNAGGMCDGPDCNDMDPNIHPGVPDRCNLTDDDCDTMIDEDAPALECWIDADRDGWGSVSDVPVLSCRTTCPSGYVNRSGDCDDLDPLVFPGQTDWFSMPSRGVGSFDYDCSGGIDHEWSASVAAWALNVCLGGCDAIWIGAPPPCGASGLLIRCQLSPAGACGLSLEPSSAVSRCH